jgi:hypothetical protein
MSLRMREPPLMVDTCTRSPGIASRRSIRRPAAWSLPSQHPTAALRNGVGGREPLGRQHRNRKIHQVHPQTGAILRTIESNRFVTGIRRPARFWSATCRPASRYRGSSRTVATRVLLRRRQQRETESRPQTRAKLRSQIAEVGRIAWPGSILKTKST